MSAEMPTTAFSRFSRSWLTNAHEIVAHGERFVGPCAFVGEVVVGRLTFARQQHHVLGTLAMEYVVGCDAFTVQDVILHRT